MIRIPVHSVPGRSCKAKGRAKAQIVAWALVDDDMAHLADEFWTLDADGYARTREQGRNVFMHHRVLAATPGLDVSHVNGRKLDNQRANLEAATRSRNMLNTADPLTAANTSGFRGVTRDDASRRLARAWRGKVRVNGKTHQTTRYATALEAARALNDLRHRLGVPEDLRVRQMPEAPCP